MTSLLSTWWPLAIAALELVVAAHAVMNKREVRSAAAWAALVILLPGVGVLLYLVLGINRVQRAGDRLRSGMQRYERGGPPAISADDLAARLAEEHRHLVAVARTSERTTRWPLLPGNRLEILRDGDQAYPAMLRAIAEAQRSIALGSYIFDNDAVGKRFVAALGQAKARGVELRVLVDDAGARYSFPSIDRALRAAGVPCARFLRVLTPWSATFANLRNHRKILVVDGEVAFTGGMNLRGECVLADSPRDPTRDLHFRVEGPVVAALMDVFAEDWAFTTGEELRGEPWLPRPIICGETMARVISDGPDLDLHTLRTVLHGVLSSARHSVRILTPYFLPDEPLIAALNAAALRGVEVDVMIPARTNFRFLDWAVRGELWKLLPHGCRIWLTPPPFDHSKAMTVDGGWALLGSSNWDPRSLRLNFELCVECYDPAFTALLDEVLLGRRAQAERFTAEDFAALSRAARLRNATARLLSPYL